MSTPQPISLPAKLAPFGPAALVTGASDGIGAATARELARRGFDLVLVARRADRLTALAEDLAAAHGTQVRIIAADLSAPDGVDRVLDAVGPEVGTAILAAGFGTTGRFDEAELATEVNMLRVNVEAVLRMAHALSARMVARGRGQLVLFGSLVGFQGNAGTAQYSATKAYVQTLAEGLAVELAPQGVEVLSVAPGPVSSGFADRARMEMSMSDRPETVARGIARAIGRSGTIRPGRVSKLLSWALATAPRALRVRLMSQILTGMAAAHKAAPTQAVQKQSSSA